MRKRPVSEKAPTNAPIVFLLGTSTAGKGTICAKIESQDQLLPSEKQTGCKVWGSDLESVEYLPTFLKQAEEVGMEVFKDNEKFQALKEKITPVGAIIHGVGQDCFKDEISKKSLPLRSLNDQEFAEAANKFLENTEGRYSRDTLFQLRELAKEEHENLGKALGEISTPNMFERMVDRAIENSKKGIPTILDMIPDGMEDFKKYLEEKNFKCPIRTVLVHVPIPELAARMEERNKNAVAEGGDLSNRREGMFPFQQYAKIFGAISEIGEKAVLDRLSAVDVYKATEKFGDKGGIRIREMSASVKDHKSQMAPVLATLQEGKKLLDKIGFEDGSPVLDVRAKVSADVIYDHAKESTAAIAEKIHGWIASEMRSVGESGKWAKMVRREREGEERGGGRS
jgi:hypothetical protein